MTDKNTPDKTIPEWMMGWVLAGIISVATLLSTAVTVFFNTFILDAKTENQGNIQLVELAIGILSAPLETENLELERNPLTDLATGPYSPVLSKVERATGQMALRQWAVDTINQTAQVKLDRTAENLLVTGSSYLPSMMPLSGSISAKQQAEDYQRLLSIIQGARDRDQDQDAVPE